MSPFEWGTGENEGTIGPAGAPPPKALKAMRIAIVARPRADRATIVLPFAEGEEGRGRRVEMSSHSSSTGRSSAWRNRPSRSGIGVLQQIAQAAPSLRKVHGDGDRGRADDPGDFTSRVARIVVQDHRGPLLGAQSGEGAGEIEEGLWGLVRTLGQCVARPSNVLHLSARDPERRPPDPAPHVPDRLASPQRLGRTPPPPRLWPPPDP